MTEVADNTCDLFIFAGEISADLHGEKLLKGLLQKNPHLKICGVGGPKMRSVGMKCLLPMEKFQVMGFIDVFLTLPKLIWQFYAVRRMILKHSPKAVVFIDYPGFNLRMARSLRKKKFAGKLCQYICPSVWAWGKKRIPLMEKNLDLLLSIFPFESNYFSKERLEVRYIGHPLIQRLKEHPYKELPFVSEKKIVSLFPGSRKKEILRNFEMQLKVASRLLASHPDLLFAVSLSHSRFLPLLKEIINRSPLILSKDILIVDPQDTYNLMRASFFSIAKSGTVTLELALHKIPTVVVYGISSLDLFIAKDLLKIRLPHYCIVNILYDGVVFPELFGPNLTEETLYRESYRLLTEDPSRKDCQSKCESVRNLLQEKNATLEALNAICQQLS